MPAVHPIFRLAVRIAAAAGAALAVAALFSRALVPGGRLSVTSDLAHPAPYVSAPKPNERLADAARDDDGAVRRALVGDPLYVDVTPPSRFETIELSLRYANSGHPVVELGALGSALDEQYELRPAEHRLLDGLPWPAASSGRFTLLQRGRRYASVDEFFRDPPDPSKVAVYGASPDLPFSLAGYEPAEGLREIDVSLRGHHRMLTYVRGEPLHMTFVVQDMNRQPGADPVIVSVYRGGAEEPVTRAILPDDGNTADDQRSSKLRTLPVSLLAPEDGYYQIELTAPADVFVRKIVTRQRKLVFREKLYLGDHVGYSPETPPVTVWTDARRIAARTAHEEALQTLSVGGMKTRLEQPNVKVVRTLPPSDRLAAVTAPKRDMLLESDGLFALSRDEYFDPLPLTLRWYMTKEDLDARGIEYLLTTYEPPAADGGSLVARASFDVAGLAKTKEGAYRFVITAPGITETRHSLRLESLTVTMRRPPVTWRNVLGRVVELFQRSVEPPPRILQGGTTYGEAIP